MFNSSLHENSTSSFYENYTASGSIKDYFQNEITITETVAQFVIFPLLTGICLFGNTSTIVLFFRKEQKTASNIFIIGLAVFDILYMLIRLIAHIYIICELNFVKVIGNLKPDSLFWILLSKQFQQTGYLYVVFISIERISAVWFPLKHRQTWTTRRSRFLSAVVVLLPMVNIVFVVDYLFFSQNEPIVELGYDFTLNKGYRYIKARKGFIAILSLIDRIIFDILPLPLALIFNIIIIIGIRRASFSKHWNSSMQARGKREAKITKMLLTISVLFVLQCGPITVLGVLMSEGAVNADDVEVLARMLHGLMLTNHVFNFMVYGIHESSFRNKICKACGCRQD